MSSLLFSIQNDVAVITLNRPDKLNALDRALSLELQEKLDECSSSPSVRCVYLTGAGKSFCTGQDLEELTSPNPPRVHTILTEHLNPIVRKIRKLKKPVVGAINGVAAGAGVSIAISCDVVVAAQSAVFIQAFSKIGLVPDTGSTFFLPRLIGLQKSLAITMLGDKVPAAEAERMGMIYKVFTDEEFAAASMKIAETLAKMPTTALYLTKKALNQAFISSFEDQLHDEELYQEQAAATADFKEGLQAFIEKRKPNFTGS